MQRPEWCEGQGSVTIWMELIPGPGRKELGRTSVGLEGREGGMSGRRWGWRIGEDADFVGIGILFPSVRKREETCSETWGMACRKACAPTKWVQFGYVLKGAERTPFCIGSRGWGKVSLSMIHRFLARATRCVVVPCLLIWEKLGKEQVVRGALRNWEFYFGLTNLEDSIIHLRC